MKLTITMELDKKSEDFNWQKRTIHNILMEGTKKDYEKDNITLRAPKDDHLEICVDLDKCKNRKSRLQDTLYDVVDSFMYGDPEDDQYRVEYDYQEDDAIDIDENGKLDINLHLHTDIKPKKWVGADDKKISKVVAGVFYRGFLLKASKLLPSGDFSLTYTPRAVNLPQPISSDDLQYPGLVDIISDKIVETVGMNMERDLEKAKSKFNKKLSKKVNSSWKKFHKMFRKELKRVDKRISNLEDILGNELVGGGEQQEGESNENCFL